MCESVYHAATALQQAPPHSNMSYESFITIMLTALGVMLAILAIGIGAMAIWGYSGIKDEVKKMAAKQVEEAMNKKLQEYPEAADFLDLAQRLKSRLDFLDEVQNQIVTSSEPKVVENASDSGITGAEQVPSKVAKAAAAAQGSAEQKVEKVEPYPGEEQHNASGTGHPPAEAADVNPGPDHS